MSGAPTPNEYGKGFSFAILVRISSDKHLEKWADEQGISYQESWVKHNKESKKASEDELKQAIINGYDLMIDRTNLTPEERKVYIDQLEGYDIYAVNFFVPENTLIQRSEERGRLPQEALLAQIQKFVPASPDEGILEVKDINFDGDENKLSVI